jgi:superfamily I DNA/RNA helicase
LLETDECRVFYKSVSGKQSSIAAWIDTILDDLCDQYGVGRKCDVGILVRNGISGEYINDVFKTKHRYFINHPLENHLSLWGKLFYQLLLFRFDKTITAEEFIDDAIAVISENDKKKLRGKIKSIRRINQGELLNVLVEVAEVLIPRGRSDEAINQLKDCLSADLSVSFTPASDDEVQIMTLHKAKGLEFDVVFHLDMYEWIFPAKRPGPDRDFQNPIFSSFEQDVNLHYVGITRARKACFLCTSSKRRAIDYSTKQFTTRNGFLFDFFEYHNLFELIELSEM